MQELIGKKIKGGDGIIVGIVFGKFEKMQQEKHFNEMKKEFSHIFDEDLAISSRNSCWGEEWEKDLIVYVLFSKPRKTISIEEFRAFYPYIKENYVEEMYNQLVPEAISMSIPISKIELE